MRYLKMLGLAWIAALSLMALVGNSSASATTLFTSSNLTSAYAAGVELHMSLAKGHSFTLTDTNENALSSCTDSTIAGKTLNTSGTTVKVSISSLTFSGCSNTVDILANGSIEFEKTGSNEAKVVGKDARITFEIFGASCTYGFGTGTTLGSTIGGSWPVLSISRATLIKVAGGFLCHSTAGFDGDYIITTPHAVNFGA